MGPAAARRAFRGPLRDPAPGLAGRLLVVLAEEAGGLLLGPGATGRVCSRGQRRAGKRRGLRTLPSRARPAAAGRAGHLQPHGRGLHRRAAHLARPAPSGAGGDPGAAPGVRAARGARRTHRAGEPGARGGRVPGGRACAAGPARWSSAARGPARLASPGGSPRLAGGLCPPVARRGGAHRGPGHPRRAERGAARGAGEELDPVALYLPTAGDQAGGGAAGVGRPDRPLRGQHRGARRNHRVPRAHPGRV